MAWVGKPERGSVRFILLLVCMCMMLGAVGLSCGCVSSGNGYTARSGKRAGKVISIDIGGGNWLVVAWIPPGAAVMGSPINERKHCEDESPRHTVVIERGYWMGVYEITQNQYAYLTKSNPSFSREMGVQLPVEQVDWHEAMKLCQEVQARLPERMRGMIVRLPTEAEWEYACRAGTDGPYAGDVDEMAWHAGNSDGATHPVGQKKPNAWGLYDMHGNVAEWCMDGLREYSADVQRDPRGVGKSPAIRGGSWREPSEYCRSAYRRAYVPYLKNRTVGFRIVISQSESNDAGDRRQDAEQGKKSSEIGPSTSTPGGPTSIAQESTK